MGDFNTGRREDTQGTTFRHTEKLEELLSMGWVDSWRCRHPNAKEFTWYGPRCKDGHRNGFRLDYVFLSPPLAASLQDAKILHEYREHADSDHAPITAVLRP